MYYRYRLCYRFKNYLIYDKLFSSINSAIKTAAGFDLDSPDCYCSIFDDLHQSIFGHDFICGLAKEFEND